MAPMLQHFVYQHPGLSAQPPPPLQHQQQHQQLHQQQQPCGVPASLTAARRQSAAAAADLSSPKSSHSGGDAQLSGGHLGADVRSPSVSRNNEAQSWTFEEQFRQVSANVVPIPSCRRPSAKVRFTFGTWVSFRRLLHRTISKRHVFSEIDNFLLVFRCRFSTRLVGGGRGWDGNREYSGDHAFGILIFVVTRSTKQP